MKEINKKIKGFLENIVDNTKMKRVDVISIILMLIITIATIYLFTSSLDIIKSPIIEIHSTIFYSTIFIITGGLFYYTMLGDKTNKPSNRPKIYLFTTVILALNTYTFLAEIFNYTITSYINSLLEVTAVPSFLIHTNVRIVTVFFPLLIAILVFNKSFIIPFKKEYREELLEYQIDALTRNVDKITDTSVDLKICDDVESGKDVVVSEKITFRHTLLDGSSGSGKTALNIRPSLAQLFFMKSQFRENLKVLTFEALEEGLCYINKPITNKFLNDNFSMEYISVYDDKKEQYLAKFKKYIIGVRDNKKRLYSENYKFKGKETIKGEIPINFHPDIKCLIANVSVFVANMINEEIEIDLKNDKITTNEREQFIFKTERKLYSRVKKVKTDEKDSEGNPIFEEDIEYYEKEFGEGVNKERYSEYIEITIIPKTDDYSAFAFVVDVDEEGDGKIIYRDLGVTVVAPDGGLAKDTVEIAESNGVQVHKIDPKMDEIAKGHIACFNPLLVGSPEKAGDIVSSILIAMEQTSGKDSNPYFTNASIRAVRNVIILLKVMYPLLHNGANPILSDALDILNNFNLVIPYVEKMKEDKYLNVRWKTVIDYFISCFYPPDVDENGRQVRGSNIGSKTKKTEEAITGIINQLDNFLGREEIKYIFCNRNSSLNFSEVLEKGECIAISTRQSELGDVLGKAFALMIILSIQNAVLGRYSEDENPEIPYHLIIDEFPFYVNDSTEVFFTFARKYKCAMTIAIQNLAQLEKVSKVFREVIFTNCTTKIVLPGANVEDREYFCNFFGIEEQFEVSSSITSNPVISENAKYSESMKGQVKDANKVSTQKLAELKFKRCYYATVDQKGNNVVGKGFMDFLKLTEHNTLKPKNFDFEKYNSMLDNIEDYSTYDEEENNKNDNINNIINTSINNTSDNVNEVIDTDQLEEMLKNNMINFEFEDEPINAIDNNSISNSSDNIEEITHLEEELNFDGTLSIENLDEIEGLTEVANSIYTKEHSSSPYRDTNEEYTKEQASSIRNVVNESSYIPTNIDNINLDIDTIIPDDSNNLDEDIIINIDDAVESEEVNVECKKEHIEKAKEEELNFDFNENIDISTITMIGFNEEK